MTRGSGRRDGDEWRRWQYGSGGAPAFTPASLSGLILWLRGDMGVTLAGAKVSAWADQSGNGNDFTQGVDANRLTYTASDADFLNQPSLAGTAVAGGLARIGFAAGLSTVTYGAYVRQTAGTGVCLLIGSFGAACPSIKNNGVGLFDADFVNGGVNIKRQSGTLLNVNYSRIGVIPCATAATEDPTIYSNGVNVGTVASSAAIDGAIPSTTMRVGFRLEGKITEVFAYNRAITAAEALQLHTYMLARYG